MHPEHHQRNKGTELDLEWVQDSVVNTAATLRRAHTMGTRRSLKKQWQAAWLLRAITCLDLTTLAGDDTPGNVARLCAKAIQPVRQDILEALGFTDIPLHVGAVCVYHSRIGDARKALGTAPIPVAAVSTGFPAGQSSFKERLAEIKASVQEGATEIDIVISREHVLLGNWEALYEETRLMRECCGDAHMKAILATGELGPLWHVLMASKVTMMAGADFIKTSTGKEPVNATLPVGLVMARAIRAYHQRTGFKIGLKPAGGIRTAKEAITWLILVKEELGNDWLSNTLFRFGASGLLTDIERQLSHHATGRYAARHHMPMG